MEHAAKKILCIEDNIEAATLINEELEERGYQVTIAHNGQEGFTQILKNPPDLVLCDITMPVMSGFDLLKKLTDLAPRFENIPFIFLTALSNYESEIRGRKMGADDYVVKPIDFEILDTIIKARLNRVARLGVWPKSVNLSEREVEVLTWAASGKTSAEIAEIINLSKRTVDFHIDNARSKLGVANRTQAVIKATAGHLIKPKF